MNQKYFIEAINALRGLSSDLRKEAHAEVVVNNLQDEGIVDSDTAPNFQEKFASLDPDVADLAVEAIRGMRDGLPAKSASFGSAVTKPGGVPSDTGSRFNDHDSELLSLYFGG
jgi:hypothetical protein